jgi:hypothetical protein
MIFGYASDALVAQGLVLKESWDHLFHNALSLLLNFA